jgi:hypothetical protein
MDRLEPVTGENRPEGSPGNESPAVARKLRPWLAPALERVDLRGTLTSNGGSGVDGIRNYG